MVTQEDMRILVGVAIFIGLVIVALVLQRLYFPRGREGEEDGAEEGKAPAYKCPRCGCKTDPSADECSQCGAEFDEERFECPECESLVPRDAKRCPKCGEVFVSDYGYECPVCGCPVHKDAKECGKCGARFFSAVRSPVKGKEEGKEEKVGEGK